MLASWLHNPRRRAFGSAFSPTSRAAATPQPPTATPRSCSSSPTSSASTSAGSHSTTRRSGAAGCLSLDVPGPRCRPHEADPARHRDHDPAAGAPVAAGRGHLGRRHPQRGPGRARRRQRLRTGRVHAAFGADFDDKRQLTTDRLAIVRQALANQEVGTSGFTIQPPAGDFTSRIWQGVFSAAGAAYAAAAGSNLLLNRATFSMPSRLTMCSGRGPRSSWRTGALDRTGRGSACRDSYSRLGTSGLRWLRSRTACSGARRVSFSAASSRPG